MAAAGIDYLIGVETETGRGLGPQMIAALVADCWATRPDIEAVVVDVLQDNRASWRALERAGFQRVWEGTLDSDDPERRRSLLPLRRRRDRAHDATVVHAPPCQTAHFTLGGRVMSQTVSPNPPDPPAPPCLDHRRSGGHPEVLRRRPRHATGRHLGRNRRALRGDPHLLPHVLRAWPTGVRWPSSSSPTRRIRPSSRRRSTSHPSAMLPCRWTKRRKMRSRIGSPRRATRSR